MLFRSRPYMKEQAYQQALAFNPNIVVIKLGTNDSKSFNWVHKADFIKDTQTMIDAFTGVYAHIGCMTTATDAFMSDIKPFMVADALADFSRDEHLMSLKYVAGRSGRVVMTEELLPAPVPASKAALREVILPLLDESDEPFDDDNLIDYGLDSVRMMALAARWRKVHGDIDFVMLAKNPTIDAWWKLLSREVK